MRPFDRQPYRPAWHRRTDPAVWHHLYAVWKWGAILCLGALAALFGATIGDLIFDCLHP